MAHPKLLSAEEILKSAAHLVEQGDADGLSLRGVAANLGVKAPSLYRYFPDKQALEDAVAETIMNAMLVEFRAASAISEPEARFRRIADVYLRYARERFSSYEFVMKHSHPERYATGAGKAIWDLIVDAASAVSGRADDTDAAVAVWAFLHGYAILEHSGAFGKSGPKGGLQRGIQAFISSFRSSIPSTGKRTVRK